MKSADATNQGLGSHGQASDTLPTPVEHAGHALRWLANGDVAFAAMLALIDRAERSIALEFYICKPGALAQRFRLALVNAVRRGVRVRVLLDAFGSDEVSGGFWNDLEAAGGELRWFNPLKYLRLSFRNHRKLLLADDVAVVGGMNIADEQMGDGVQHGWRDLALEVRGPVVSSMELSFERMWALANFHAHAIRTFLRTCPSLLPFDEPTSLLMAGPGCGHVELARRLYADLLLAREVSAHAPYFLPSRKLRGLLRRVAQQGRVRILVAANSDVLLAQLATHRAIRRMRHSGVQFYDYRPQMLHSKLLIVDNAVYVGSANLDVRSRLINFELMLRTEAPEIVAQARALFDGDLRHSVSSVLSTHSPWQRLREEGAYWLLAKFDPYLAARSLRPLR